MNFSFSYKITPHERFNRTVSVLIILVMFLLLFYFITFSWYGESVTEDNTLVVGNISLSVITDIDFTGIYLEPDMQYNKSTTIVGSAVPGDENTNDAFVRVKLETTQKIDGDNIIFPVYNVSNWIYDDATGWYYYIGIVNQSTSATFNTHLQVTYKLDNSHQNTDVDIYLTVEGLQKEFNAYLTSWPTAPATWVTAIQSL